MVKSFLFSFLFFCCAAVSGACAQETQVPDDFDPLEERAKIAGAYIPNYRELMREIVRAFGDFVKSRDPNFKILLDGGQDLLARGVWENDLDDLHRAEMAGATNADERFLLKLFSPEHPIATGTPNRRFMQSVNGLIVTNQICQKGKGKLSDPVQKIVKEFGLSVIGIEHCSSEKERQTAQQTLAKKEIPIFADTDPKASFDTLDPKANLFLENNENIDSLDKVRNVLVLTNTRNYADKDIYVSTLAKTNYDMLIIEPFFKFSQPLSKEDVKNLQSKQIGARRLVFATLNVAVAEDTRPYWETTWKISSPRWLRFQSKTNPAGLVVDYWDPDWKRIIGIYFRSIMDLGFDGVVLQGLDEHKTYERIIVIN